MIELVLNILTLGLKPLYEKNMSYYKLINEFRLKLPREQNQAKKISAEDLPNNSPFKKLSSYMSVLDLSKQKVSVSEAEIDQFYNRLNTFDFTFVFFKSDYQNFTKNLNRFNPQATNKNFDIAIVQHLLKDNSDRTLKPFSILLFRMKWKYKLTSYLYRFNEKIKS